MLNYRLQNNFVLFKAASFTAVQQLSVELLSLILSVMCEESDLKTLMTVQI